MNSPENIKRGSAKPEKPPEKKTETERPPILYHGSTTRDIEEIEPKRKRYRDENEGVATFATPDLSIATTFLLDKVVACGKFENTPYALIIEDRNEFIKNDNGGHVYVLPSDSFQNEPSKGLGVNEWTSKEKVRPIKTIDYSSSLDAAIENGVQVYFIDERIYRSIRSSYDHGASILRSLQSENQKRGINVKVIPRVED